MKIEYLCLSCIFRNECTLLKNNPALTSCSKWFSAQCLYCEKNSCENCIILDSTCIEKMLIDNTGGDCFEV